jgi:hypothetical protein
MSADISATLAAAMNQENRRRELASQAPGLGALMHLGQPPAAHGVGISDIPDSEVKGEGYATEAAAQPLQVVTSPDPVYGQRPSYSDDLVGGIGFVGGRQEAPIRVLVGTRSAAGAGVTVLSATGRSSLWSRLRGKLRRG